MGQCIDQWQQHLSWSQAALLLCLMGWSFGFLLTWAWMGYRSRNSRD
jgi:hypothetical protein